MALREIVLDTETTGFDPWKGDRIVEIGCVELINHLPSGRTYHQYINPQRSMPQGAFEVHGLGDEFLAKQPVFEDVADAFLAFIADARLVIHNAAFDMKFLNAELGWADRPRIADNRAIDTLEIARQKFPGAPASLDALCKRFRIDNTMRTLHGALLDSEILAEVYLELIGGRQTQFILGAQQESGSHGVQIYKPSPRPTARRDLLNEDEKKAHLAFVKSLGKDALWLKYLS